MQNTFVIKAHILSYVNLFYQSSFCFI